MATLWIVLSLSLCDVAFGDLKIWVAQSPKMEVSNDWTPPRNRECSGDILTMPKEAVASLSKPLHFRTLVLPWNGEILLNEGAVISPGRGDNCAGKEFKFSANKKHNWWNPSTWANMSTYHLLEGPGELAYPFATPETDKVPCPRDQVYIATGPFRMKLEGTATVQSLNINGKDLSTYDFREFTASATGRRLVEGGGQIMVESSQEGNCSDVTGCACTNARDPPTQTQICEAVGPCPSFPCSDPVRAQGFCCPVCCSLLNIEYREGFRLEPVKEKLRKIIDETRTPVICYVSKRYDGLVQVVCRDKEDLGVKVSAVFINHVKNILLSDDSLHVSSVLAISSSKWISQESSSSGLGAGMTTGIVFIFLLLAALGGVAFYLYKKRRLPVFSLPGFDFVRFDRTKLETELATTPHEDLQPVPDSLSSSSRRVFHNPLYSKEVKSDPFPDKRENPVYGLDEEKE